MTTTILVTGATGFLGGHILTALRDLPGVTAVAAARDANRVPAWFTGEVHVGDLADPGYRREVVRDVDVILHAGTWSTFWGHAEAERRLFLEPSLDLVDQAVAAGVSRFVAASTVALSTPAREGSLVADDSTPVKRGYWPHLDLMVDVEDHMRAAAGDTQMVSLRLGHFVGPGASLALVPALVPRLKTRLVPWVDRGRARLPLVSGEDMGRAFALAAVADGLGAFESINVLGAEQPTAREVFAFVAEQAGAPKPWYSVPVRAAFAFAALMEAVHPLTRAKAPFLTRALVHVGQNWHAADDAARTKLGYEGAVDWRDAARASIEERRAMGFPWPALGQAEKAPAPGPAPAIQAPRSRRAASRPR